jgi:hypothetical protein
MSEKFIELTLGNYIIVHGYDSQNKEIAEEINVEEFSKKIISMSRIKSVSNNYILTDYIDGRWIYWKYEEDYEHVKKKLIQK